MRGSLSVLTRERDLQRYRTGIFVATAEPELIESVLATLKEEFPKVKFTPVGPRAYDEIFRGLDKPLWLEDLKVNPWQALRHLRRQGFEIAAVVLAGRPTFSKLKLLTFLLNPARFVVFNENADSFALDRAHWSTAARQCILRCRFLHPGPLLFVPFGLAYLLWRLLRLNLSGRVMLSATTNVQDGRN